MTKELFLKVIDLLQKQYEFNNKFDNLLDEVNGTVASTCQLDKYTDKALWLIIESIFCGEVVDMIQDWLYCYVKPYGKENPMRFEFDGVKVEVTSVEELYDKVLSVHYMEKK